jgi:O-antigen/teichoic acid export membrane protein
VEKTDSLPTPGFASRVRSAVFWRSGSQILAQIVMWAATIIVVRLLDPQDYGLFAMTQVVLVLFNFLNGYSFASSLIQAESLDRHRIAQVFGLLILLNGGLALAQFLAAPLAAAYFKQPIVADMLRLQVLLYLATPFIAMPSAVLARGLDFRNQALANMAGALAGAVTALSCAMAGVGVWTLVYAPIALFIVRAIGLTIAAKLLVKPSFDFRGAGSVLSFGGALLLCQFFWIIQSQADIFIAGRHFSPHDLGLYSEALFLTLIFSGKFIPPLNEVAFPAYAELEKQDKSIASAFTTSVRLTMFLAFPLYFGMAAIAQPLVASLFGPKWLEMVPLVATLALAMPFNTLQIIFSPATNALGKPGIYVRSSIAGAILMPAVFYFGIQSGAIGLAQAWLIAAPTLLLITMILSLPAIGASWSDIAREILPSAAAASAMAATVHLVAPYLASLQPFPQLAILVGLGGAIYLGLLWRYARPMTDELYTLVTRKKLAV